MSASENMSERTTGEQLVGARHARRSELSPSAPDAASRLAHGALSGVLDHLHDGIVVYDPQWRFRYMNRSAEEYLGCPASQVLGQVLWEVFPAMRETEAEAHYRRAVEAREPAQFELRSPVTGRWVEVRAFPSEQGLTVVFRDMTARHDAELALRAREARYRAMFENTQASVLLTTVSGTVQAANPAACRTLGLDADALIGRDLRGLVDDDTGRLGALLAASEKTGAASAEWRVRRGDGSTFLAAVITSRFHDDEGDERAMLSLLDVTARRRGEDAMAFLASASATLSASLEPRETAASLARLVVPARADLCVVDLVERDRLRRVAVVVDDPALEAAAEALRESPPGQDAREGTRKVLRTGEPLLAPRIDPAWLHEVAGDSASVSVIRALGPRSLIIVPLATAGRRIGVLSLARIHPGPDYDAHDLSVARRLADHAALALENARIHRAQAEALRQRDEVLGVVSHDLRNPLHAIALNARIVSRRSKGADEAVADLQTAIEHANRLVEDLLATVCADADALRLMRSYENLSSIFAETLSLHRTLGEERAVTLAATIDPRVPEVVFVDRHRLLQCVCNLVGNALKFTPSGGAVTVRAAVRDAQLVISVSDTGPGIAADEVPHLFERFWQGAARRRGDAGLGLSIVKAIAEAHGGCVDVRTALGAGTTFDVVLPIVEPQDGRGDSVPPPERVVG